jgi:predicted nucleotide-binding protein (sugar kinase/HSP70/actin superfamily)
MIVSFPHLGYAWVPLKTLFDKHGIPCVVPPRSSASALTLGVGHSPETACLPYKILLGNMIEGLEQGADTLITVGGQALCRLGYYARLHEATLRDLGFDFRMLVFDWQDTQITALARFVRSALGPHAPWGDVIASMVFGFRQLRVMQALEDRVRYLRPRVSDAGGLAATWEHAGDEVSRAHTLEELRGVRRRLMATLDSVPLKRSADPTRVLLTGEFFLLVDAFASMEVEEELGRMGVDVERPASLLGWARAWLFLEAVGLNRAKRRRRAAWPYLRRDVSGDVLNSVGDIVLRRGQIDGVVHLMPLMCTPELVAQNVMPRLQRDYGLPVLSLVMDERVSRSAVLTRLEAFVDLLERRRQRQPK